MDVNPIAEYMKENRKVADLTQEEFALRSGLDLRLVRDESVGVLRETDKDYSFA